MAKIQKRKSYSSLIKPIVEKKSALEIFTDREDALKSFEDEYHILKDEIINDDIQSHVLYFYGIGGIGKTLLTDKIQQSLNYKHNLNTDEGKWIKFDFRNFCGSRKDIIQKLTKELANKYAFAFPVTTYAFLRIYKESGGDFDFSQTTLEEKIEGNMILSSIVFLTRCFTPIGSFVELGQKIIEVFDKKRTTENIFKKQVKDYDGRALINIIESQNIRDVQQNLHIFFSYDLENALSPSNSPLTVFFDTYEHYINVGESNNISSKEKDVWLRDATNGVILNVPGILWVLSGREKLLALEKVEKQNDSSWNNLDIKEHLITKLSKSDIYKYLDLIEIKNQDLRDYFCKISGGLPFVLDLCYSKYLNIKSNNPQELYNLSNYGYNIPEIIKRYFEIFDFNSQELIKELSVLENGWNDILIEKIIDALPFYDPIRYKAICNSSMVLWSEINNKYEIQDTIRKIIVSTVNEDVKSKIQNALFAYYEEVQKDEKQYDSAENSIRMIDLSKILETDPYVIFKKRIEQYLLDLFTLYRVEEINEILLRYENNESININSTPNFFITILLYRGYYFYKIGKYKEFLDLMNEYTPLIINGKINLDLDVKLNFYYYFATALSVNGEIEDALYYDLKCFEGRKKLLGERHEKTLKSLINIAIDYFDLQDFNKSLETNLVCYKILNEVYGENHLTTLKVINNLSNDYSRLGDYKKGLIYAQKSYDLKKEKLGETNPSTLLSLNNLCTCHWELKQYDKAIELANKCYKQQKEVLGKYHPSSIETLENICGIYSELDDYNNCLEFLLECLELEMKVFGPRNENTLRTLKNISVTYSKKGNFDKAREYNNLYYDYKMGHKFRGKNNIIEKK